METTAYQVVITLLAGLSGYVLLAPKGTSSSKEQQMAKRQVRYGYIVQKIKISLVRFFKNMALLLPISRLLEFKQLNYLVSRIHKHIYVKVGLDKEGLIAFLILLDAVIACLAWWFFTTPIAALIVLLASYISIPFISSNLQRKEKEKLTHEMPQIFRTLAMALSSGMTLTQAIDYVGSRGTGPLEDVFARSSMRLRSGMTLADTLKILGQEIDAPGMQLISTALLIAQRTGSPLKDLFEESAKLVERQGEFERLLSVKTAQVRLSIRMVCTLPILLLVALSLMSPDFRSGLMTPGGAICVLFSITMDALALWILKRLMRGVI